MAKRIKIYQLIALGLLVLNLSCLSTGDKSIQDVDSGYYARLLPTLLKLDTLSLDTIDFARLRFSYLVYSYEYETPSADLYVQEMDKATEEGRFVHAAQWADSILAIDFTRIEAHLTKAYYQKQYNEDFTFHRMMFDKLLESIKSVGDGKSPETAYLIAHKEEEYQFIYYENLKILSSTTTMHKMRYYDVFECETSQGEQKTIYFDITPMWNINTMKAKRSLLKGENK